MQNCTDFSHVCAYHCAQLSYTTQHIFPLTPDKYQSSDAVYWRGGVTAHKWC